MSKRKTNAIYIAILVILGLSSCEQNEGIGGSSHIEGELIEKFYNEDFSVFQYEQTAKAEDIYLLFGDNNNIGEDTETSLTGDFQFQYLWSGNYSLYYFSEDTSLTTTQDTAFVYSINLGKNETKELGKLYKYTTLDWDQGQAQISGKVTLINYRNESEYPNMEIKDITDAQAEDVYLTYNNAEFYSEKIKTNATGHFIFPNLLKGTYTIFVYSEDLTGGTANIVKSTTVEITEQTQSIVLEDFVIEKI